MSPVHNRPTRSVARPALETPPALSDALSMDSYHPSDNSYLLPKGNGGKPLYKPSAKATFVTGAVHADGQQA